jgi:GNAT superfamily N-acetyltransferase
MRDGVASSNVGNQGLGRNMTVDVDEERAPALTEYARVPIAFTVRDVVDVVESRPGRGTFTLQPRAVERSYVKDYDDHGGPEGWTSRFDLSHWHFFVARVAGERVGGAAVVFRAPDVGMLRGRQDVALLWDIRVTPAMRNRGVGAALMAAVEAWSAAHGAAWIEVETQNVNVPACRFYERTGFVLREAHPHAYASLPDEVQLLWCKRIGLGPAAARPHAD